MRAKRGFLAASYKLFVQGKRGMKGAPKGSIGKTMMRKYEMGRGDPNRRTQLRREELLSQESFRVLKKLLRLPTSDRNNARGK